MILFVIDQLGTLAELPLDLIGKGPISQMLMISPEFRERWRKGLQGDVWGLESGATKYTTVSKRSSLFRRANNYLMGKEQQAGGMPTVLGDVGGVTGYLTNFRKEVSQGVSPEEALKNFEEYEATQQARGEMYKIPLQSSKNMLLRVFTMFGSTVFLQMNKVFMSGTNINRDFQNWFSSGLKRKNFPKAKDFRALYLNYAVANVLFVIAGNMFRLWSADEEDREEIWKQIQDAFTGLNLIYQIPLFGAAVEYAMSRARGEYYNVESVVNPLNRVTSDVMKGIKKGDIEETTMPIVKIATGVNVDPLIGTYNYFSEGGDDNLYSMLGASESSRPAKTEITPLVLAPETDEYLKKYAPEKYRAKKNKEERKIMENIDRGKDIMKNINN